VRDRDHRHPRGHVLGVEAATVWEAVVKRLKVRLLTWAQQRLWVAHSKVSHALYELTYDDAMAAYAKKWGLEVPHEEK
jgi:hypothetical protein